MNTFKYKLNEKVMANIANPRNAESFGRLMLYTVITRLSIENAAGMSLSYELRPVDVRDGSIHSCIHVEEASLKSVEEYNLTLEQQKNKGTAASSTD